VAALDAGVRKALGQLLRDLRRQQGLSLAELSRRVGVSASALSQFETGRAEPSLGTLWQLGRALDASLFDFFASEPKESVQLTRAHERTVVSYGRARYEALARSNLRHLDHFVLHLQPGEGVVREAVAHAGEECGLVLEGEMVVHVGGSSYRLGPGDALWFDSEQPHTYEVVGERLCVSVWADTIPFHRGGADRSGSVFA
jgi:transcriptional regulator with XRE-family HTH domain